MRLRVLIAQALAFAGCVAPSPLPPIPSTHPASPHAAETPAPTYPSVLDSPAEETPVSPAGSGPPIEQSDPSSNAGGGL